MPRARFHGGDYSAGHDRLRFGPGVSERQGNAAEIMKEGGRETAIVSSI